MEWSIALKVFPAFAVLLFACSSAMSSSCVIYGSVCHLHLDSESIKINQDLLKNCPDNCTKLSILSADLLGRTIDRNAFQKFTNISSLSIRSNLTSVQNFSWLLCLRNLESLNLSSCGIKSLNTVDFTDAFPSLQVIDLSHNSLEYLYLPFMFNVPKLRYLDISSNRFSNFPDLPSHILSVNIADNPLVCTCTNVQLYDRGKFLASDFNCTVSPCSYFCVFENASQNRSLSLRVAESFTVSCHVNASNPVKFGIFSPIGFIPGPSWHSTTNSTQIAKYEYVVLPVQHAVLITVWRTAQTSFLVSINYARGHHGGVWRCAALSDGGFLLDDQPYIVFISTGVEQLFLTSIILGFIVMGVTLILGLIIGAIRYVVETRCFRKSQTHKFVVRPLLGVIPVPSMQSHNVAFVEEISLNQRICPICFVKPAFLCGYCLSVHTFSKFEVLRSDGIEVPTQLSPKYRHNNNQQQMNIFTLLNNADCSPPPENSDELSSFETTAGDNNSEIQKTTVPIPHENVLNYDFPSEFCHCYHLDMRFTDEGETQTSAAVRDVKLIFRDEQLAQEYAEVLEVLQAAAKSNDTATFRERLEDFRGRLLHDVGARVRVAREEIVAVAQRSVRSVARLRDQSGAVAQFMKSGLSQVCDGMRSVAEMCTGGGAASDESRGGLGAIGQSISVVSIYKDETTKKAKERCVSNFTF